MAKSPVFKVILVTAFIAAIGLSFYSIVNSVSSFKVAINDEVSTDIVLAGATPATNSTISLPVTYFTQTADECVNIYDTYSGVALNNRQFEWSKCGYEKDSLEEGIISATLGEDLLPVVGAGGAKLPNRGIDFSNFTRWFHAVEGLSVEKSSTFKLLYSTADGAYAFTADNFHPVDTELFTMNLSIPFLASRNSSLEITADDDTWVFLDDNLILDLGGIHPAITAAAQLPDSGTLHIFHANRDSASSAFNLKLTNLAITTPDTTLAYDDTFATPLGETSVTGPHRSRTILTSILIQFSILCLLMMLVPVIVRYLLKNRA